MASTTVKATWTGPYPAELPDGRTVEVGETVDVDKHQADISGHWEIASGKKPAKDSE